MTCREIKRILVSRNTDESSWAKGRPRMGEYENVNIASFSSFSDVQKTLSFCRHEAELLCNSNKRRQKLQEEPMSV